MIAIIPNDRSVVRMSPGLVLQTGSEAERLLQKRINALRRIRQKRGSWVRPRRRLRVVS